MALNNYFDKLSEDQKALGLRVFDLVIGRVLKRVYSNFDEKTRQEMEKVFDSEDDGTKENFVKENIPNFKKIFKEEAEKIEQELKEEIQREI